MAAAKRVLPDWVLDDGAGEAARPKEKPKAKKMRAEPAPASSSEPAKARTEKASASHGHAGEALNAKDEGDLSGWEDVGDTPEEWSRLATSVFGKSAAAASSKDETGESKVGKRATKAEKVEKEKGKKGERPVCKYGAKCYRIGNKAHVAAFQHPHVGTVEENDDDREFVVDNDEEAAVDLDEDEDAGIDPSNIVRGKRPRKRVNYREMAGSSDEKSGEEEEDDEDEYTEEDESGGEDKSAKKSKSSRKRGKQEKSTSSKGRLTKRASSAGSKHDDWGVDFSLNEDEDKDEHETKAAISRKETKEEKGRDEKKEDKEEGWNCPACTFRNPNSAKSCETCGCARRKWVLGDGDDDSVEEEQEDKSNTAPDGREWCKYGERCYRKNMSHLEEFAHPKDFPDAWKEENKERSGKPSSKDVRKDGEAGKEAKVEAGGTGDRHDSKEHVEEGKAKAEAVAESGKKEEEKKQAGSASSQDNADLMADLPAVFAGLEAVIYGKMDAERLRHIKRFFVAFDGDLAKVVTGNTTHIITDAPWDAALESFFNLVPNLKFVSSDWASDCISQRKRLDEGRYAVSRSGDF